MTTLDATSGSSTIRRSGSGTQSTYSRIRTGIVMSSNTYSYEFERVKYQIPGVVNCRAYTENIVRYVCVFVLQRSRYELTAGQKRGGGGVAAGPGVVSSFDWFYYGVG